MLMHKVEWQESTADGGGSSSRIRKFKTNLEHGYRTAAENLPQPSID